MKKPKKHSIIFGFGNVFNIAGNNHNIIYLEQKLMSDRDAIASDWKAIGDDFRKSLKEIVLE